MVEAHSALVARALEGELEAIRALVDLLAPAIQLRVVKALARAGKASGRSARQESEDIVQEVFASLFDHQGRALRAWEADRGLSLPAFVGFVAERQVWAILSSGRRSPWSEEPTVEETLEGASPPVAGPEPALMSRQFLSLLLGRLREELTPKGMQLFELLFLSQRSAEEVRVETGLGLEAIYAWKSRLSRRVQRLRAELEGSAA
jgi:DNA-directed RNA polymerase specialized sigma24 family protein